MSIKFFFGFLISMVSLLGLSLQQPSNSHQEIIIKFCDAKVITLETQNNTIAIVKKQLQKIGINYLKVSKNHQGHLKISYFSSLDTASIKKVLNEGNYFAVSYLPNQNNKQSNHTGTKSLNLRLDIFKIPKTFENPVENSGLVVQLLSKTNRYFVQDIFGGYSLFHNQYGCLTKQNKFKYHSKQETKVGVKCLKTIQIRAGPFSYLS
jgi:hypothetical protein